MAKDRDENLMERMMKQVIKGLIYLLIFVVVFALIILPLLNKYMPGVFGNVKDGELQVMEEEMRVEQIDVDSFACIISGMVHNTGGKDYTKATIEFTLYNESGDIIGSAMGVVENIGANQKMEFAAGNMSVITERPHTFKLKRIMPV